jgi:serine/threonine protein phosphatase PrpC
VLSSAIGGEEAAPVITQFDQSWDQVGLLCSDGLTKHVSDGRIAERLRTMTSAKQVCETLLQDALDAGGSDNITIVVGRLVPKDGVLPS